MWRLLIFIIFISCKHSFDKAKKLKFKDPTKLKSEFDICPWWNRSMNWEDYLEVRRKLQRPALFKYVDKIKANKFLKEQGFAVIKIYYSSHEKIPFVDKIKQYKEFVAKPSHMSSSSGLVIYSDNINLVNNKPITLQQVQDKMFVILDTPSNSNEWYLQNMQRGFLIQEYIKERVEIKFHTVWGKVVTIVLFHSGDAKWYWYNKDGSPLPFFGEESPPKFRYPDLLQEGITIAEKVADRTDALRVDLLVKFGEDGSKELLVNELEIRSMTGGPKKYSFIQLVHLGYENMCVPY